LAELARRFDAGARLVSVLGIGGTGKTRLATRFAWTWQGDYPGGAWFCDLSSARTVQGIAQAVAQSLSVPLGAEDPVQQLGHAIAARGSCLLVLDNFEQVARHAEETLGRWLDRAADARFLVTTREVLGLPGEEAMALAPLEAAEAIALFERRARAVNGSAVDADEAAAIAQLVKLLDGLPLAIELAAARVRVMPPRALVARMDQRFRLLTAGGGRRDRQATLRATFDWSWELLSDAERSALAQLSVFEGGFTLEAAEGVLDLRRFSAGAWAVDLLQSLVDKSFVRSLGGGRFDLLSSVQDYAAGHLGSAGRFSGSGSAARNGAHARHAGYFARLAEHGSEALHLQEFDNLAAACRRAALLGDAETAVAALEGAWSVLEHRGPFDAGIELAQAVCQLPPLDAASRARAALIAGLSLNAAGRVAEAQLRLRQALEFALAGRRADVQARVLVALGDIHVNLAMFEAGRDLHEQARAMAAAEGLHSVECMALNGLGSACVDLGHIDQARDCYEAALRAARVAGDRRWQGWVLGNLGTLHFSEGALERAAEGFSAALEIARELGDRKGEGNMLCNLAAVHEMRGRLSEALQSSQEALQVARAIGHVRLECTVQCNLGLATMEMRQWTQAQAHLDAALTLSRHLQDRRSEGLFLAYMGQLLARQGRFDEGRACLDAGEPLLEQVADGNGLGLLHCRRAELEALAGHAAGAEEALDRARSISTRLSAADDSELGASLRMAVRALAGLQPSAGS
jgi:predicted ATPase